MPTIEHPYKPRLKSTLLGLLFFGGATAMWIQAAIGNDRGLVVQGFIHLGPAGATKFYWWMAAICSVLAAGLVAMLASSLTSDARLTLSPTELAVPRSAFARASTVVPRERIRGVDLVTVQKQRFLHVHHDGGTLTILRSCLPTDAAFDEVCSVLGSG